MIKSSFFILITFLLFSCRSKQINTVSDFTNVKIDTILMDKISIRALVVTNEKVFYAANNNRIGTINLSDKSKTEIKIEKDTLKLEFRSLAQTKDAIFVLNIGNSALLYKLSKDLKRQKLVYEERHEKVFYDSMQFWSELDGIAIGDPIDDCLNIIITSDGGETWSKISCENLPKTVDGEAAFASSNTNVIVKKDTVWIVSGGKKSRVFFSKNKGITWNVFETPMLQGEAMTGIFSADFYDSQIGFIVGGNYDKPEQNFQNKAITFDGGTTWKLVGEKQGFGSASCVQFVPNSNGKQLVCVGATGLWYSKDFGENWQQLSNDSTLYTIRFINNKTAIAAGKNKIIRLQFD
jgi:photosystem II stability/assembly factor-like uncharacterized protein